MTIDIKELDEVKKVNKPWGYEKWIADGKPNFKYVLKEILFKSNFKSSKLWTKSTLKIFNPTIFSYQEQLSMA